jgi:ATP-binding cassette subfamily F protein 3
MGEDGSFGGSPCVDIHLINFSIDLAGLPILEDASLTMVRIIFSVWNCDCLLS